MREMGPNIRMEIEAPWGDASPRGVRNLFAPDTRSSPRSSERFCFLSVPLISPENRSLLTSPVAASLVLFPVKRRGWCGGSWRRLREAPATEMGGSLSESGPGPKTIKMGKGRAADLGAYLVTVPAP